MKTVKTNISNEIIIRNSKFITFIFRVNNINEIEVYLNNIKNKYKDATHCCYAYILNNLEKASDDNEPSNTAGLPILNILKVNNLNFVLCVVVRYFGGIKLGASGLIRAYARCTKEVITKDNIIELEKGISTSITFDYSMLKDIDFILKDSLVINKEYNENIEYEINISNNTYNKLKIINNINFKDIKEIYINKEPN